MGLLATKTGKRAAEEPQPLTISEAQPAAAAYTEADENIRKIEAQKRTELMQIEQKYAEDLIEYTEQRNQAQNVLVKYAAQLELDKASKKSIDVLGVTVGFRAGKAKLTLLEGFDWDKVRELVKKTFPKYVRKVEELEKDKLLKDFANDDMKLGDVGIRIDREGKYYVKID